MASGSDLPELPKDRVNTVDEERHCGCACGCERIVEVHAENTYQVPGNEVITRLPCRASI